LFFDDGYVNQYKVVLPILLKYDYKASFGVITGYIGTGHDVWEYMDEDELKVLAECGMDIACHTHTHPNLTENMTDEQLREEIVYSKEYLENIGFEVNTMVYPYFEWDDRVIESVKKAGYSCARAGWSKERAYDLRTANPKARYHVNAWQMTDQTMEEFKTITDYAGNHSVVSLVYHFILDEGPEKTSTTVADFESQMSYLKEAGFTVVLLPDLFAQ
jgi:peptidoglycan/xylan/chitin deacetylase (PgdA/CDA1 family)